MAGSASAKPRLAPVAGTSGGSMAGAARPSGPCISSLPPPSCLFPGLLTVQVAAWDGCLATPTFCHCQDQQAEEQRLGGCHGDLQQRVESGL